MVPRCFAALVTLAWDENPEPDIAGYKMHYGTTIGSYDYIVDVGNYTNCTISGLEEGTAYYFSATAYNNQNSESDFSEESTYTRSSGPYIQPSSPLEAIIDNGEAGTSFTGTWNISSNPDPYGESSLYNLNYWVNYSFEAAVDATAVVSLWWTQSTRRCTSVPIEIYDGSILIDTVQVNQKKNGGQWNELGEYSFNGTARTVVISEGGGCSISADAVRFSSISQ